MSLCWKCRVFHERHCHHDELKEKPYIPCSYINCDEPATYLFQDRAFCEPHFKLRSDFKEKPKCWCEREGEKKLQVHDYTIDKWNLGHYQMRGVEIAQYCPYCGKGLKEAI